MKAVWTTWYRAAAMATMAGAIGLAGCGGGRYQAPVPDYDASRQLVETKMQRFEALPELVARQERLFNIAHPLLRAAEDICAGQAAANIGMTFGNRYSLPEFLRQSAARIGVGDFVSVIHVAAGSGAARADIRPGDRLLAIGDWPVPAGIGAVPDTATRISAALNSHSAVALGILRDGLRRDVVVAGDQVCRIAVRAAWGEQPLLRQDQGAVLLTAGLIDLMESDAELAALVAHALGHRLLELAEIEPVFELEAEQPVVTAAVEPALDPEPPVPPTPAAPPEAAAELVAAPEPEPVIAPQQIASSAPVAADDPDDSFLGSLGDFFALPEDGPLMQAGERPPPPDFGDWDAGLYEIFADPFGLGGTEASAIVETDLPGAVAAAPAPTPAPTAPAPAVPVTVARFADRTEAAADYLGVYLLARAGFDHHRTLDAWQRVEASRIVSAPARAVAHPFDGARNDTLDRAIRELDARIAAGEALTPDLQRWRGDADQ